MISSDEAIARILANTKRLGTERVALEQCRSRVLAADVVSHVPLPPFSHSAMDGYAVNARAFKGDRPWLVPVRAEARAGRPLVEPLAPGTACRIFSGAQIPTGADCVIRQEDVVRRDAEIVVSEQPQKGQNIRAEGSDLASKTTAIHAGERLSTGRIALAASLDHSFLTVAQRPVVTIASTGDELRSPGTPDRPGSVIESNSIVIGSLARQVGAIVRTLPFVADDSRTTEARLAAALDSTDVLITIGGVSVGDHDLVRPALHAIGAKLDFTKVAIKPGKPFSAGQYRRPGSDGYVKVLCLPGNPSAATLTFLLFGVPVLRALQGDGQPLPPRIPLRILGSHVKKRGREEYLRARLEIHDGEQCAALLTNQSAGAVTSFAEAQALVVASEESKRIKNGDRRPTMRIIDICCTP